MSTTVTSLTDHAAAKERARLAELDRAIMARAKHIKPLHNICADPRIKKYLSGVCHKGER